MQKKFIITGILGAAVLISAGVAYANDEPQAPVKEVEEVSVTAPVETTVEPVKEPAKTQTTTTTSKATAKPAATTTTAPAPAKVKESAPVVKDEPAATPAKTIGKLTIYKYNDPNLPGDYYGEIVNGKANGQGEVHWLVDQGFTTNHIYKGNFVDNRPMYKGTNIFTDKDGVTHSVDTDVEGIN